jgi:hypothetical protein
LIVLVPNVSEKKVVAVAASGVTSRAATVIKADRFFFITGVRLSD